jgi:SnoaL-like domain
MRELFDRQEIYDRLMLYLRGIDRNDGELVQQTFWPDALVDHGHSRFRGEGIGEYFANVSKNTAVNQTHFVMNIVYEISGDLATTEAQHLYNAETERNGVAYLLSRCLRYIDQWERRDGTWRIFHRTVVEMWNKVDPIVERYPPNQRIIKARGDRADPSYELFELTRQQEKPPLELPDNAAQTTHAAHRTDVAGFRAPAA